MAQMLGDVAQHGRLRRRQDDVVEARARIDALRQRIQAAARAFAAALPDSLRQGLVAFFFGRLVARRIERDLLDHVLQRRRRQTELLQGRFQRVGERIGHAARHAPSRLTLQCLRRAIGHADLRDLPMREAGQATRIGHAEEKHGAAQPCDECERPLFLVRGMLVRRIELDHDDGGQQGRFSVDEHRRFRAFPRLGRQIACMQP